MNIKTKVKGFMSFNAVLLCLVALMAGYSLLQIYGSQFSALSASRKALQSQQFAQSEADLLRNTSYDELDAAAHDRQVITGANGWMSEISLEAETTINEVPQRLATVKIYRNSTVTVPDFSLKVPLSSASGGGEKFPIGTILPYKGKIADIPKGWALCDGSNGTPDLRGRFLEGNDMSETFKFKEAGLPNLKGRIAQFGNNCPFWTRGGKSDKLNASGVFLFESLINGTETDDSNENVYLNYDNNSGPIIFDASKYSNIYKDDCETVQPTSYMLMFIMKIK